MEQIANIPEAKGKERIVIIGGGFAGLEMAKRIDKKYYQVVLIDKNNYYQFQPLFYQVATAGLEPSSISYPLRKMFQNQKDFHVRMCEATRLVPAEKQVETNIGCLTYDYLVIATGCDTNYFGNDALRESTFALKSVSEALLIRNRLLLSLEEVLSAKDEEEFKELFTFVVIGGGATGVELAGALADMKKGILPKDYPELDFGKMEIHLVDASPRLLAAMSEKSSLKAARTLQKRRVILHQGVHVEAYDKPFILLSNGQKIRSRNVFWVAGVTPKPIPGLSENAYERNRLLVNEFNQVNGYKDLFALGDTALFLSPVTPKGHPQVAQVAIQMARRLAENLNAKATGRLPEPFVYKDKGSLATIGRNAAVADLGKFHFGGPLAWMLWLFVHIMSIVGMRNRVAVFVDWAWNYFNYDVSLRLLIRPRKSEIYHHEESD
ncbi:MAG: NAD(P)/FAD-dependent oxidoreductase [Massilibacteroides sp.]|nr:NAD(P)/FAD-dependent oxidoreductase [Massilibacteroides sp.]MDD3061910.1 NAD(P)/FAD-dependent oxidoreductase [Massilibacteroides sp.]MDD4115691.1 NAD(P)/FAD-dependent oxidoreductase [Massilibacteroides sp.]MDD4661330.1 NAD(P)/FAD-dependent oxidoreductase [Massilibacteroides sp.]